MEEQKQPKKEQGRTTRAKAEMLEALKRTRGVIKRAAESVGINRRTHAIWYENDPEYRAAYDEINENAIDSVEEALFKKIGDLDTASIIFFLKTRGKHRGYVERTQTQEVKAEPFVMERSVIETVTSST